MPADALFAPSLSSDAMLQTVSDEAWLEAMLHVEAALARAQSKLRLIPSDAANEIAEHCDPDEFDLEQIGRDAMQSANPVGPLVAALRARVSAESAAYVHRGATSQDILDTAMMLVARQAIILMVGDLNAAAAAAAVMADRHRGTVMAGRTLLQQASVTTMGLKAAGWLNAIIEAIEKLRWVRAQVLAVQFGGAVGTLAALDGRGLAIASQLAARLGLVDPVLPWHTNRIRIAEVGSSVAMAGGVAGKIALDVALLSQTEVDEVRERPMSGRGGSSALPQKQNAVSAVEILAAVRGMMAQAGVLMSSMVQEHERAAGAWQAEWRAMSELLLAAGGVTWRLAAMLKTLDIDAERMQRNLDLTGGLIMSEAVTTMLAQRTDALAARKLVEAAVATARKSGRSFADVLAAHAAIKALANADDLARALEPSEYLGESSVLIDAVLDRYRRASAPKGDR